MTFTKSKYFGLAMGVFLLLPSVENASAQTRTRTNANNRSRCSRIYVSSPEAASSRRGRPKFSAAEIMDLQLQAFVSRKLTGNHRIEFKIYTPKGNLYQSMQLQFDADEPVAEDASRRSRRYQEVSALLPVAGTSIVSSSMYGTWRVEAFLDGDEQSCSRPRQFEIQP